MSATDDRIKKILDAHAEEARAAEQAKKLAADQSKKEVDTSQQALNKWVEDTHVITDILTGFEQKMAAVKMQLAFQDKGREGSAIAVGRIFGRVSGRQLELLLNVHPNGEIHVFHVGPKVGPKHQAHMTTLASFSVFSANRSEYESLILDAIEAA